MILPRFTFYLFSEVLTLPSVCCLQTNESLQLYVLPQPNTNGTSGHIIVTSHYYHTPVPPGRCLQLLEILEIYWNLMVLVEIFVYDDRPHWFPVIKLGTRSLI